FQRGGFLLAMKSGLPILPLAIDGTYDVFRVGATRITPAKVTVRVGTPIPTAGRSVREKDRLAEDARAQIATMLGIEATEAEVAMGHPERSEGPQDTVT